MSSNISELCKQSMRCKDQEKKREIDYLIASELGCNRKDVETIFQAMHPGTKRPYGKEKKHIKVYRIK